MPANQFVQNYMEYLKDRKSRRQHIDMWATSSRPDQGGESPTVTKQTTKKLSKARTKKGEVDLGARAQRQR